MLKYYICRGAETPPACYLVYILSPIPSFVNLYLPPLSSLSSSYKWGYTALSAISSFFTLISFPVFSLTFPFTFSIRHESSGGKSPYICWVYVICLLPAGISLSFNKVTCEFISKSIPRPSPCPHLLSIFVWLMPYRRYIITSRPFGIIAFMAAPMILFRRRLLICHRAWLSSSREGYQMSSWH